MIECWQSNQIKHKSNVHFGSGFCVWQKPFTVFSDLDKYCGKTQYLNINTFKTPTPKYIHTHTHTDPIGTWPLEMDTNKQDCNGWMDGCMDAISVCIWIFWLEETTTSMAKTKMASAAMNDALTND